MINHQTNLYYYYYHHHHHHHHNLIYDCWAESFFTGNMKGLIAKEGHFLHTENAHHKGFKVNPLKPSVHCVCHLI
jgi:hypothetical protein